MNAALYVHLPFCPYICPYCDFAKVPYRADRAERYLRALRAEIAAAPAVTGTTLYLGGGTPTTYDGATLAALIVELRARFALPADAEITCETNPDAVRAEDLVTLAAAGVNRLSIGVQSFDPVELRVLGRRHTSRDVAAVVAAARVAGITNIGVDLIFGVPGQTEASWRASLAAAVALDVTHCSTYGLTIEDGTPYARWYAREPQAFCDEASEARWYEIAMVTLEEAGFEHYEISNFARPGMRSRHNAMYWRNVPYLGFGVGAASYREGVRSVHTRDVDAYVSAALVGAPIPGEREMLQGAARLGEAIMLALRTCEGVDAGAFRARYDVDVVGTYRGVVERLAADALIVHDARGFRLTRRGRLVANDVCGAFLA